MEDLLSNYDSSSLNIVASTPVQKTIKAKKNKSKFDKRREKAAISKGAIVEPHAEKGKTEGRGGKGAAKGLRPSGTGTTTDTTTDKTAPASAPDSAPASVPQPATRKSHSPTAPPTLTYLETHHPKVSTLDSNCTTETLTSQPSTHIYSTGTDLLPIHPTINNALKSLFGITRPTTVQTESCRIVGTGTGNAFLQSETGSGKTLAYLLPVLHSLAIDSTTNTPKKVDRALGGTRSIILCPTRELATQTYLTAAKLTAGTFSWIVAGCLSGGEKRKSEKARLRKGVTILIATPGRLLDHLGKTEALVENLKGKLEWLVLDEADRLLDMGLGKQVEEILQHLRVVNPRGGIERDGITWRSILVSATVTTEIQKLASKVLGKGGWKWAKGALGDADKLLRLQLSTGATTDPSSTTDVTTTDITTDITTDMVVDNTFNNATPQQLTQSYMVVSAKLRLPALAAFLAVRASKNEKVVVFMSTCDCVDYHYELFSGMDSIVTESSGANGGVFGASQMLRMHGNVPHAERISTIAKFGKAESSILLATDVAARGLNLPGVDWIVQYDAPSETNDYIHRAGRAARAGAAGCALLFLLPSEVKYVEVLKIKGLKRMEQLSLAATLESAAVVCKGVTNDGLKKSGGGYKNSDNKRGDAFCNMVQIKFEDRVLADDKEKKHAAGKAKKEARAACEADEEASSKKGWKEGEKAAVAILESGLVGMGKKAFVSFVRAYSAKEKSVRHIFSSRTLHLGHIARSFALKDKPSDLKAGTRGGKEEKEGEKGGGKLAFSTKEGGKRTAPVREDESAATVKKKRTAKGSFTPQLVEYKSVYEGFTGSGLQKNKQSREDEMREDKKDREENGKEMSVGDKRKLMMDRAHQMTGMNAF